MYGLFTRTRLSGLGFVFSRRSLILFVKRGSDQVMVKVYDQFGLHFSVFRPILQWGRRRSKIHCVHSVRTHRQRWRLFAAKQLICCYIENVAPGTICEQRNRIGVII